MFKLGVDIGGTKINVGVLSETNEILYRKNIKIAQLKQGNLFENVATMLRQFLCDSKLTVDQFEFCGIGVPGTVDETGRIAVKLPNLNVYNVPAAEIVEKVLGIETKLVQDSRAAAWGEYVAGHGQGYKSVVCITLGTGIGLGMVMDGKIFAGATGTAGEMGHNIVVKNGRACGCGKKGCLGVYTAGLGLNLTAQEVLGENATSVDLFSAAKGGNSAALEKISEAVEMLSSETAGLYNSLAPDCILFSGGISKQEELYVKPLIHAIYEKIYAAGDGKRPYIGIAKNGEDAPMIGAALLPHSPKLQNKKNKLSASIMCADMMNLAKDFKELEQAGIDLFHMDIMDGHFVPNMMLSAEQINRMRQSTDIPFDVHIMAENPELIVDALCLKPNDMISIHYESTRHLEGILSKIKAKGLKAAVAINPATSFECVKEVLPNIDMILVMTVNPGFAGQKLITQCLDKTRRIRDYLNQNGYEHIEIEVDGNCSFENVPRMQKAGANIFVLGTSGLFRSDISMKDAVIKIHQSLGD